MPKLSLRGFKLVEALPRMAVDALLLSASVFVASYLYLVGWIVLWRGNPDPAKVRQWLAAIYFPNAFMLALVGVFVFTLSGFYTHARGYRGRFKALVIFQAVSIAFLVHSFLEYAVEQLPLPRLVEGLAWMLGLMLVGGSRLLKGYVVREYRIERKSAGGERSVRNVLVIGGAGYIGSVLVRRLLTAGYRVRVLDELLFGDAPIAGLRGNPQFELLRDDFRHVEGVVRAIENMDAVVHLGAIVGDPACNLDSRVTLETNLAATALIKHVCHGAGVRRFLFASSCSVYGASPYLLDERSNAAPISLYACTKVDAERLILGQPSAGFAPTILRLATAFGWSYRPRFDLVVNLLVARALRERSITIFNQTQWRPFIHVEDIARAFLTCLQAPTTRVAYEIFNAGDDRLNATLGEVAAQIETHIPGLEVVRVENADHRNYRVNFDKIRTNLDFTCEKTLEDGIAEIQRAFQKDLVKDYREAIYHNDRSLAELNGHGPQELREDLAPASTDFLRRAEVAVAL
ncbi:MAG TPA: NAD-dependent epimerase/dehydratase family protein [Terriglobia bacterium]|nr:NAD-dependent epimerase/dehydratase family protein [Terriglobia bacterium]